MHHFGILLSPRHITCICGRSTFVHLLTVSSVAVSPGRHIALVLWLLGPVSPSLISNFSILSTMSCIRTILSRRCMSVVAGQFLSKGSLRMCLFSKCRLRGKGSMGVFESIPKGVGVHSSSAPAFSGTDSGSGGRMVLSSLSMFVVILSLLHPVRRG